MIEFFLQKTFDFVKMLAFPQYVQHALGSDCSGVFHNPINRSTGLLRVLFRFEI